ncbi:MAG: hypothetical protein ETSY1_01675 [Candidatus Entotheonella factor]|uniref:Uncharacterized protein n=1 Tax=Entotheonella factor TaxID=1429438 RepID=W4LZZ2_ENTF1|nr:MAG: hypothetical protein ETSY1_01675 [Candidatus Entotheonella factor]
MDTGDATLTPLDNYEIWFGNKQASGTLIAVNRSKVKSLTLEAGGSATITYDDSGNWVDGPPA